MILNLQDAPEGRSEMKTIYRVIATVLLSGVALVTYAQNTNSAPRGPVPFEVYDQNGDGVISREELAAQQQKRMSQRQSGGRSQMPMGRGGGMGRNMPSFADFDLNSDGTMTEDEFVEARGQRIADRAKQGYKMRGLKNMRPFSALDQDGNGLVDEKEFGSMQEQHRQSRVK